MNVSVILQIWEAGYGGDKWVLMPVVLCGIYGTKSMLNSKNLIPILLIYEGCIRISNPLWTEHKGEKEHW